jgi:hypothetical protein
VSEAVFWVYVDMLRDHCKLILCDNLKSITVGSLDEIYSVASIYLPENEIYRKYGVFKCTGG